MKLIFFLLQKLDHPADKMDGIVSSKLAAFCFMLSAILFAISAILSSSGKKKRAEKDRNILRDKMVRGKKYIP